MKIAVISSGNIPSNWANSINTTKHANGFKALGHEVELLTVNRYYENKKLRKIKSVHEFYGIDRGIKISYYIDFLAYLSQLPLFKKAYNACLLLSKHRIKYIFDPEKKIAEHICKNNFNLAYGRTFRAPYYLIKSKVPVIIETHAYTVKNPELKRLLTLINSPYFLAISTISEKLKDNFARYGVPSQKIIVQEDAVDLLSFDTVKENKESLRNSLGLPIDQQIISYCGSLRSGKAIPQLLEVANKMKINQNVLFLIIGGPENFKRRFHEYCKKRNITNVQFVGYIENRLVPLYLKASDLLIMLYSYTEKRKIMDINTTSPIKLFEYMASQRPIIVSKIPTIEKVVTNGKHALMPEPDNLKDIIDKTLRIIENKDLGEKLAKNAYELSQAFTYDKRCKRILDYGFKKDY